VPATAPVVITTRPKIPAPEPPSGVSAPAGTAVGTASGFSSQFSSPSPFLVGVGLAVGVLVGVGLAVGVFVGVFVGAGVGVGVGPHPRTQNTLCLTSAPCEPSASMVSLRWKPCCGCGSIPLKSRV
jgi:hypothetical protein